MDRFISVFINVCSAVAGLPGFAQIIGGLSHKLNVSKRVAAAILVALSIMLAVIGLVGYNLWQVSVIKIELNHTDSTIAVGDSLQMSAIVYYSNGKTSERVKWSVNNQSVAGITDDGLLTALDDGKVVVTAMTVHRWRANVTEAAEITVKSKPTGYTIIASAKTVKRNDVFYITVIPEDENYSRIIIHGEAPSGEHFANVEIEHPEHRAKCLIDTETGTWKIYATVINEFGEYEAQKEEDFVFIEVLESQTVWW